MNRELTTPSAAVMPPTNTFNEIKISLASPERILAWSEGEIKKPETINYRTFKPERDGLFCARIFGPVKDYECLCGKYKRMKFRGITCEKCGVEVTVQKVRRERMGHIELAAPVAHIWFLKLLPSRIGTLLNIKLKDLESVLYFEKYVITDAGMVEDDDFRTGQLLTEAELLEARDKHGQDSFSASIGAEAIREMLSNLDLQHESMFLREQLRETRSVQKTQEYKKRLQLVECFIESGNKPEWMVMKVLPVIPPEIRPLVPLDGGRFATSDLNDLYRRVIYRNNRLKKLIEIRAPDIMVRNEKRMLQESVDALLDNGRRGRVITNATNKRPLKSLSDMLKGKQGRFRQNLLGKRVDFSGRSVIVTGPELKLHQCGLPKKMAKELFKPFIFAKLDEHRYSATIKQSKRMVEQELKVVWDVLDEVIREHPVLLNRAPTLHRLGIQAFEPVLVEGKAIQLHPLVCSAFNADFDGDQMAVHVPLSVEAQLEARVLMMSTNNVLSPANGSPIVVPSQDMILGIYYTSIQRNGMPGEGMVFASVQEVEHALAAGIVHRHAIVEARVEQLDRGGEIEHRRYRTTPGRILLGSHLPRNPMIQFDLVNRELRKREVQDVIDTVYRYCGQKESVIFCDHIMELGFREACNAGISFCKNDMVVPSEKEDIVAETRHMVAEFEMEHRQALLSEGERYKKTVDAWSTCTDRIQKLMENAISAKQFDGSFEKERNSIFMMTHSGARGSRDQMKQLAGMRGLITKGTGDIIETPIISNFREGLNVAEYFNSAHGSRKGLADTALKTANAGYLTRRLVDVAQDCIVRCEDCNTDRGIGVSPSVSDGEIIVNIADRIVGRVLCENVADSDGVVLATTGELIDETMAAAIQDAGVQHVRIRSPLTCEVEDGVCSACYGRDLSRGTEVNVGEAVGIMAAQSIGEPGTQLTMRTFHIGGVVQQSDEQSYLQASFEGTVRFEDAKTLRDAEGRTVVIGRSMRVVISDPAGGERFTQRVPYGATLLAEGGQRVKPGTKLYEWDPYATAIYAEHSGMVRYVDLIQGTTIFERTNEESGFTEKIVIDAGGGKKQDRLRPQLHGSSEAQAAGRVWFDGAEVHEHAPGKLATTSANTKIRLVNDRGQELYEHQVPQHVQLCVKNGQKVQVGATLFEPLTADYFFEKPPASKPLVRTAKESGLVKLDDREFDKGRTARQRTAIVDTTIMIVDDEGNCVDEAHTPQGSLAFVKNGQRIKKRSRLFRRPQKSSEWRDDNTLRPSIVIVDEMTGLPVRHESALFYHLPMDATLRVNDGDTVKIGDQLFRIPVRALNTRDITGGLPRVADLFEARKPKDLAFMTRTDGIVSFGREYKSTRIIHVNKEDGTQDAYKVPKGVRLSVQEGDSVRKGDLLIEGTRSLQDILQIQGLEELAKYMIQEVQKVYQLQGVNINDKHIEVIVRQMLQKRKITDPGDTVLLENEIVDRVDLKKINEEAEKRGERPAECLPVILGITRAALQTRSFVSAASFQETTKVLTEAAIRGRTDKLTGLKENVIVGNLIPAGTGRSVSELRRLAAERDQELAIQQAQKELEHRAELEGESGEDEELPRLSWEDAPTGFTDGFAVGDTLEEGVMATN